MTLALMFPQFAPNLYDLSVMLQADRIILLDTEPWSRKSRMHRAQVRTPDGTQWINIPVRTEDRNKTVREVRIDHSESWIPPLLRSLKFNYANSHYYDFYEPEIRAEFESAAGFTRLMPFVLQFQQRLFRLLDLSVEYERASDLSGYDSNPDLVAEMLGADCLLQEHDSRHYQRQAERRTETGFTHPEYRQHFEGFEPWCSVLDLLFQKGPESFRVIDRILPGASG